MKKTLFLVFLLFILSSFSVLAYANWPMYQYFMTNYGYQNAVYTGVFNQTDTYSELSYGVNYQPIIADWDSDGVNEIIGSHGSILYIYTLSSAGSLNIENSFNMGGVQDSIGFYGVFDSENRYIVSFENITYSLTYDGSELNRTLNYTNTGEPLTGINCASFNGGYGCYYGLSLPTTYNNITEFNPTTGAGAEYNSTVNTILSKPNQKMALEDFNADGNDELVYFCTLGTNTGICVTNRENLVLDTTFSTDGFVASSATSADCGTGGVLIGTLQNGFGDEICYTYNYHLGASCNTAMGQKMMLVCVDFSGATLSSNIMATSGATWTFNGLTPSVPFLADVNSSESAYEVCSAYTSADNVKDQLRVKCYNGWDSSWAQAYYFLAADETTYGTIPSSADMDNDGLSDILMGERIWFTGNTGLKSNMTISSSIIGTSNPVPVDVNGDNLLDICGQTTSETFCATSTYSNTPPILYNNLSYGGFTNYYTINCLNTANTFSAMECGNDPNCNYANDNGLDTERLVTNCGQNSDGSPSSSFTNNLVNGTYSLSSPSFSCVFNQTGIFNIRIFIQDINNPADYSSYNAQTIKINVMDGISGETCNINPVESTTTALTTTNTTEGSSFGADITGGSQTYKSVIALIAIISLIIVTSKYTSNAFAVCGVGLLGVILAGIIGWMTLSVVILIIISMVVLLVLFLTLFPNTPGG